MSIAAFTSGIEGVLGQVETLAVAHVLDTTLALVLGTMDSSVAGRRAILLYRGWAIIQVCGHSAPLVEQGRREDICVPVFMFIVNAIFWPWLGRVMLETLRARGTLTTQAQLYVNMVFESLGISDLASYNRLGPGHRTRVVRKGLRHLRLLRRAEQFLGLLTASLTL